MSTTRTTEAEKKIDIKELEASLTAAIKAWAEEAFPSPVSVDGGLLNGRWDDGLLTLWMDKLRIYVRAEREDLQL